LQPGIYAALLHKSKKTVMPAKAGMIVNNTRRFIPGLQIISATGIENGDYFNSFFHSLSPVTAWRPDNFHVSYYFGRY